MSFIAENGVTSAASDAVIVAFLALFTIATFVAATVFLCKYIGTAEKPVAATGDSGENKTEVETPAEKPAKSGETVNKKWVLAVILAAGFIVRMVFGMLIRGYREDYALFSGAISHLRSNGLSGYYNGDTDAVLYPVVYMFYLVFGGFSNGVGLSAFSMGEQFIIKLPLIIADLFSAVAIYLTASRYFDRRVAYVLCALVCVCPIFFIGSAIWTTPLVFTAMFALYACYFLAQKKYGAMIAFATAAAFSSREGIFLFPAFCVFAVFHFVRAMINIKNANGDSAYITKNCSAAYSVPVSLVLSLAGAYLIGLFMISSYDFGFFKYIYEFLLAPLGGWKVFTYNGLNIYTLFNFNGRGQGARFPVVVFAIIFALIAFAVVCIVYFSKRNRGTMVMLAAYISLTLGVYFPGASAITLQFSLPLILAAYTLVKDKRLLITLFVVGLVYVINSCGVLGAAGYLNDLDDYNFSPLSGYIGSTLLSGGLYALPVVCSVITVLAHVFFTIVAISVGMTGRKQLLQGAEGIGGSMRELFTIRKVEEIVSEDK